MTLVYQVYKVYKSKRVLRRTVVALVGGGGEVVNERESKLNEVFKSRV